jgi:hypothetical protein
MGQHADDALNMCFDPSCDNDRDPFCYDRPDEEISYKDDRDDKDIQQERMARNVVAGRPMLEGLTDTEINTHGLVCDFGMYRGQPYTRIPVSYLRWMISAGHSKANIAEAEIKRRGTTIPTIEISGHAIDRASRHCLWLWKLRKNRDQGIYSWLHELASYALNSGKPDKDGRITVSYDLPRNHGGKATLVFVFTGLNSLLPALKTVVLKSNKKK